MLFDLPHFCYLIFIFLYRDFYYISSSFTGSYLIKKKDADEKSIYGDRNGIMNVSELWCSNVTRQMLRAK